ncbi:GNAT family N-acetyltransferase [Klebsiella aerogenes]|nr:GNAT family N-acetyltransferase [Klebsiella aerogenes]
MTICSVSLAEIIPVYRSIPEFDKPVLTGELFQRIELREKIALIAYSEGKPAGFKLGYAIDDKLFYSWLGGVLPAYRQSGVAQRLLIAQEECARVKGYCRLQVKTRNSFPGMLRLLIKNNYHIIDLEKKGLVADYRVLLEKNL